METYSQMMERYSKGLEPERGKLPWAPVQWIKMFWMGLWRLGFIASGLTSNQLNIALIVIAVVATLFIRSGRSINTWPLLRKFFGHHIIRPTAAPNDWRAYQKGRGEGYDSMAAYRFGRNKITESLKPRYGNTRYNGRTSVFTPPSRGTSTSNYTTPGSHSPGSYSPGSYNSGNSNPGTRSRPYGYPTPEPEPNVYTVPTPEPNPEPNLGTTLKQTTNLGFMTGYEPNSLRSVVIPRLPSMRGTPGSGLGSSSFSKQNISLGVKGETLFAKALAKEGILGNFDSYWSVAMPRKDLVLPDHSLDTDIDCVLTNGSKIILIDLKYYTSGEGTWTNTGDGVVLIDRATGKPVGKVHKTTRNMEMALDRFKKLFPASQVEAYVVLMPTDRGEATVDRSVEWPGGIPAVTAREMIRALKSMRPGNAGMQTSRDLTLLVKH